MKLHCSLKSGKATDVNKIRPDMLNAQRTEGVLSLPCAIKVAWHEVVAPVD